MRCSHCGHENPGEFKFCGMCGNKLVVMDTPSEAPRRDLAQEELASTRVPAPAERPAPVSGRVNRYDLDRPAPSSGSMRAAEEFLRNRPQPTPPPPLEPEEPRTDRFAGYESDQPSTEIHGPSFLGLSGSDDNSGSYLLEDDGGGSSAVRVIFLLILLAAAAVVWWKWEPIKTYVWTQASMHAEEAKPATATPQTDASTADSSKPADGSAQSMPQDDKPQMSSDAPAASATPANSQPAQPANAAPATPAKPEADKPKPAADAPADKKAAPQDPPSASQASDKAAAAESDSKDEDSNDQLDADQPASTAAAKKSAAPAKPKPDDSAALLTRGEDYLYGRGGVPQSCRQALVYFKAAADKQNPAALSHVGAMYATGECGVRIDRVQAYKWFSKAYELQPSNQYLERNLTMLWREMSDQERQAVTRPASRGE